MAEAVRELPRTETPKSKASFVDSKSRAPAGWTRFKIFATSAFGNRPVRYVLARSEAEARACYLETLGVDGTKMQLVVTPQPD